MLFRHGLLRTVLPNDEWYGALSPSLGNPSAHFSLLEVRLRALKAATAVELVGLRLQVDVRIKEEGLEFNAVSYGVKIGLPAL